MKRLTLISLLGMTLLTACGAMPGVVTLEPFPTLAMPTVPISTDTPEPVIPTDTATAPTEAALNPKLPAAPFDAQTYVNEDVGFALDYPAGWTVNEMILGDRGSQIQFLSAPELADAATLPEGATRVNVIIYQWDPKNDLAAFVANQKSAWLNSGFTILEEEQRVLELGLPAVQFTIQTPETQTVFLIVALKDRYLVLSGEGDMELVKQIIERVRPISN